MQLGQVGIRRRKTVDVQSYLEELVASWLALHVPAPPTIGIGTCDAHDLSLELTLAQRNGPLTGETPSPFEATTDLRKAQDVCQRHGGITLEPDLPRTHESRLRDLQNFSGPAPEERGPWS